MKFPRLRHTHPLGHVDLAQPGPLALLNQPPQHQLTALLSDANNVRRYPSSAVRSPVGWR